MKPAEIEGLKDEEIAELIRMGEGVLKARAEKRKQDAIARIKEIAASVHISVNINGQRGRPAGMKPETKPVKV